MSCGGGVFLGRERSVACRGVIARVEALARRVEKAGARHTDRLRDTRLPTVTCAPRTPIVRLGPERDRFTETPGKRRMRR